MTESSLMVSPRKVRFAMAAVLLTTCGCVVVHVDGSSVSVERLQSDVEVMRQAMSDMRMLGTAIESYAVDQARYPTSTDPDRTIGGLPFSRFETLSATLKVYVKAMPTVDPWDSPYLLWSNGQHYVVLCLGADAGITRPGALAEAVQAAAKGDVIARAPSHCMEDEIFFADGQFVWYPRDWVRRCGRSLRDRD